MLYLKLIKVKKIKLYFFNRALEVLREHGVENWDGYEDAIKENEEYINDCDDILDEMPIRIGYDINIDWIKNIEECRLKNEIDTRYSNVFIQEKEEQC